MDSDRSRTLHQIVGPSLPRETLSERESWRSNEALPEETQERIRRLLSEAVEEIDRIDQELSAAPELLSVWRVKHPMGAKQRSDIQPPRSNSTLEDDSPRNSGGSFRTLLLYPEDTSRYFWRPRVPPATKTIRAPMDSWPCLLPLEERPMERVFILGPRRDTNVV